MEHDLYKYLKLSRLASNVGGSTKIRLRTENLWLTVVCLERKTRMLSVISFA